MAAKKNKDGVEHWSNLAPKKIRTLKDPQKLKELAADQSAEVRAAVAANPNTPTFLVYKLREDTAPIVRIALASNHEMQTLVLDRLAKDQVLMVRQAVSKNPRSSAKALEILANEDDDQILNAVAKHQNTSRATLALLSKNDRVDVRVAVSKNPHTTVPVLLKLAGDSWPEVREPAKKRTAGLVTEEESAERKAPATWAQWADKSLSDLVAAIEAGNGKEAAEALREGLQVCAVKADALVSIAGVVAKADERQVMRKLW